MDVTYRISKFSNSLELKTLKDIYDIVISQNKDLIDKIRSCKDKEQRNELKKQLPTFNTGKFKNRVCNDDFISSQILCFDIDKIGNPEEVKKTVISNKDIALCFISPSGKGVKLFCKLDFPITDLEEYREVYLYYYNLFESFFGYKLRKLEKSAGFDDGDKTPSLGAYLSYDPECYYNHNAGVLSINVTDASPDSKDDDVLSECSRALQGNLPSYSEWIAVGFSLANLGEDGYKYFRLVTDASVTDKQCKIKFNSLLKANSGKIPIGHFISLAKRFGAKINGSVKIQGQHIEYPFMLKEDGLWNVEGDNQYMVASFKQVKYLYDLIDGDKRIKVIDIDGNEVRLTPENLSHHNSMRVAMANTKAGRWFGTIRDLDKFVRFLDNISTGKEVCHKEDIGKINENLWNLGNVVWVGNTTKESNGIVWVGDKGYLFNTDPDIRISTETRQDFFREMLELFFDIYKDRAVFMLGFAVSSLFFDHVCKRHSNFPHLYLFGPTNAGKSKTIEVLIQLFGLQTKSRQFMSMASKSTTNAAQRISSSTINIPIVLDEYTDAAGKDLVKSRYDDKGKYKAHTSNDNSVYSTKVGGSTIISTRHLTTEQEIVTRCVFCEFNNTNKAPFAKFMKLYNRRTSLSMFIIFILSFIDKDKLLENIDNWQNRMIEIDKFSKFETRIITNFAIFLGGYECIKHLFKNIISDDEIIDSVYKQLLLTQKISDDASQPKIFATYFDTCLNELISNKIVVNVEEFDYCTIDGESFSDVYICKFHQVYNRIIKENNVSTKYTMSSVGDMIKQLKDMNIIIHEAKRTCSPKGVTMYNPVVISKDFMHLANIKSEEETIPF